jgi:hypothetical protein
MARGGSDLHEVLLSVSFIPSKSAEVKEKTKEVFPLALRVPGVFGLLWVLEHLLAEILTRDGDDRIGLRKKHTFTLSLLKEPSNGSVCLTEVRFSFGY